MDILQGQRAAGRGDEFEVFVFPSGGKAVEVKARADDTLRDILTKAGLKPDDDVAAFLPDDGHGKPDDDDKDDSEHAGDGLKKTLRELGVGRGGRIVYSSCRWVDVTVNYQSDSPHRRFRPSARVGRVLRWTTKELKLKDEDYDVVKLTLGDGGEVRNDVRLAELLTHRTCALTFELVLKPRIQG